MRRFVPDEFKQRGRYWAAYGTKRELNRRRQRIASIISNAKPGNSHFIRFPSSMATRTELDPAAATVGPSLSPSTAETPSEQVKKVGGELVNQHPEDPNTVACQKQAAAQVHLNSSEAWAQAQETLSRA